MITQGWSVWITVAIFLAVSSIMIPIFTKLLDNVVTTKYDSKAVRGLFATVFKAGIWYFVLLVSLNILGMRNLSAALAAASGFVALGIAYAAKDMIADTVAGVHLANDDDFQIGQTIEVDGEQGEVVEIGLRNSKFDTEEGIRVLNNSQIDEEWKRLQE